MTPSPTTAPQAPSREWTVEERIAIAKVLLDRYHNSIQEVARADSYRAYEILHRPAEDLENRRAWLLEGLTFAEPSQPELRWTDPKGYDTSFLKTQDDTVMGKAWFDTGYDRYSWYAEMPDGLSAEGVNYHGLIMAQEAAAKWVQERLDDVRSQLEAHNVEIIPAQARP